jgi:hypothetical protein
LAGLDNCTDDLLWHIFVLDTISGIQRAFSWKKYIESLSFYRVKNSLYCEYYSIIKRLPLLVDDKPNYLRRLEVCRDLALYRTGDRTLALTKQLKGYINQSGVEAVLVDELRKILIPESLVNTPKKLDVESTTDNWFSPNRNNSMLNEDAASNISSSVQGAKNGSDSGSKNDKEVAIYKNASTDGLFHFEDILLVLALLLLLPFAVYAFIQWMNNPLNHTMLFFFLVSSLVTVLLVLHLLWKVIEWLSNMYLK